MGPCVLGMNKYRYMYEYEFSCIGMSVSLCLLGMSMSPCVIGMGMSLSLIIQIFPVSIGDPFAGSDPFGSDPFASITTPKATNQVLY